MSYAFHIEYPEMDANKALHIKDLLQREDILGDFGPGIGWWASMLGKKAPKMSYAAFIEETWYQEGWDGKSDPVPLTEKGRHALNRIINSIYDEVGGPVMVYGSWAGKKPNRQVELNVHKFTQLLEIEGWPNNTMMIIDRRLNERSDQQ